MNAALDASDLVARLKAKHVLAQKEAADPALKHSGLDLMTGEVVNNFDKGVLEPALSKVKALKFAAEACISLLRIDDLITLNPTNKPK